MPDTAANRALGDAVREVLETMFFACVYDEIASGEEAGRIQARLPFAGGRQGEFRLGISPGAARTIAAGFLGVEDENEIGAAQIGDVVCEVANIVCGSVLSRLGADLAFDLQPPRLAGPGDESGVSQCAMRTFDLGDGTLTAGIHFD